MHLSRWWIEPAYATLKKASGGKTWCKVSDILIFSHAHTTSFKLPSHFHCNILNLLHLNSLRSSWSFTFPPRQLCYRTTEWPPTVTTKPCSIQSKELKSKHIGRCDTFILVSLEKPPCIRSLHYSPLKQRKNKWIKHTFLLLPSGLTISWVWCCLTPFWTWTHLLLST